MRTSVASLPPIKPTLSRAGSFGPSLSQPLTWTPSSLHFSQPRWQCYPSVYSLPAPGSWTGDVNASQRRAGWHPARGNDGCCYPRRRCSDSCWPDSAAPRRARRYPPSSGSPPPIMGLQHRLGIFTRRTFSRCHTPSRSPYRSAKNAGRGRGWPLGILQLQSASNSEGEMQGSSWPSCSWITNVSSPVSRPFTESVLRYCPAQWDYRIDISGDQPARRRANGRG